MRLDHINIAAPMVKLTEVRDFYCDVLGLEEGPRPDFDFMGYWLYGDGRPIVHLMESDHHYPTDRPHHIDHIAFQLEELPAYLHRLQAADVEYRLNYIADFNLSQVFCQDPCGNGIEVNFPGERV